MITWVPGLALGAGLLLSGCASSQPPSPTANPSRAAPSGSGHSPAPATPPPGPGSPTQAPVPTATPLGLSGVRYVIPPGWQVTTPSPAEADLSSENGLAIVVRAAPGSSQPEVTVNNGTRVSVDGSPGYQRGARSGSGYLIQVDVEHAGTLYELRCTGADSQDVGNVCDGFMLSMHWAG